jgi:tetratricopeptide (TPR) repeat protein
VPTLFVIDPRTETVLRRVLGSATAPQLNALLDEAYASWKAGSGAASPTTATGPDPAAAQAAYARGEQLFGAGQDAEAATAYEEALARAPQAWALRPRTADALVASLSGSKQPARCVASARQLLPTVGQSPVRANLAAGGLDCALSLEADDPARKAAIAEFETLAQQVLADTSLPLAADDRSGIYGTLVDVRKDAGDADGAKRVAGRWAAYLEAEATRARTPEERAVFDPHRLSAYIEMGTPEKAVPMLQASERDLPGDYNPPARLAVACKELGRWDEAQAAADRALKLAYGPRKVRIYLTRVDIDTGRGDTAAARRDLQDALAFVQTLPAGRREGLRKMLEDRLARVVSKAS